VKIDIAAHVLPPKYKDALYKVAASGFFLQNVIKTNLGFNLEFHDYGSLPRYETKARRFKDLRRK